MKAKARPGNWRFPLATPDEPPRRCFSSDLRFPLPRANGEAQGVWIWPCRSSDKHFVSAAPSQWPLGRSFLSKKRRLVKWLLGSQKKLLVKGKQTKICHPRKLSFWPIAIWFKGKDMRVSGELSRWWKHLGHFWHLLVSKSWSFVHGLHGLFAHGFSWCVPCGVERESGKESDWFRSPMKSKQGLPVSPWTTQTVWLVSCTSKARKTCQNSTRTGSVLFFLLKNPIGSTWAEPRLFAPCPTFHRWLLSRLLGQAWASGWPINKWLKYYVVELA